jgi:hypothetical protein
MKKFHHFQVAATSLFLLWRGGNDIAIAFTIVRQRRRCGHDRPMRNNNGRRCTHVVVEGWYDKNQHSLSLSLSLSLSSDVVDTIINSDSDSNNKKRDALRKQTLDAALLAMHSLSCQNIENTADSSDSLSQKKYTSDASSQLFNQRRQSKSNNNMVEVRRSTIPNAGLGLFASKNIKIGDILSYYPVNTIGIVDAIDGSIVVRQRRRDDVVGDIDTIDDTMTGLILQRGENKDEQDQQYVTSNDDVDDDETYLLHVLGSGSRTLMNVNIALDLGGSSIFVNNVALKQHHREQHNDDSSSEKSNYSSTSTTKSTATPGSSTSTTNNGFDGHRVNDGATILTNDEAGTLAYYHSSRLLKNCIHVPFGPCPVLALIATRNVLCGEELLTTYGCSCESFCMQLYVLIFVELYLAC